MDPNLNAALSSLRTLLLVLGGALSAHGLITSAQYSQIETYAGIVMIVGPAAWGFYNSLVNFKKARAVGVNAGINMALAGKALAADGKTVVSTNDGTTPPLQATVATAEEIIKDFGPAPASIAKA